MGLRFEEACFNRREKKEQFVLEGAEVLQAVWKPLQSTLMDDSGWIYAANGPTTPSELGDRAFSFKNQLIFLQNPGSAAVRSRIQHDRGFVDFRHEKWNRS